MAHIKKCHIDQGQSDIVCPIQNCGKVGFKTSSAFTTHLSRFHAYPRRVSWCDLRPGITSGLFPDMDFCTSLPESDDNRNQDTSSHEKEIDAVEAPDSIFEEVEPSHVISKQDVEKCLARLMLMLESKFIPSTTIQLIAEEIAKIAELNQEYKIQTLKESLNANMINQASISDIVKSNSVDAIVSAFNTNDGKLRTTHTRKLYFKTHFPLVEAIEKKIDFPRGPRNEEILFHYVPIEEQLRNLLKDEKVWEHVVEHKKPNHQTSIMKNPEEKIMRDFCDGSSYSKNPDDAPDIRLDLLLFDDDFDPKNSLGELDIFMVIVRHF